MEAIWYQAVETDDRTCQYCGLPAYAPTSRSGRRQDGLKICIIRDADEPGFIVHERCQTEDENA